ncbi:MAG: 50S ribosomal protein L10 [Enterobacteriaceae bacterium]
MPLSIKRKKNIYKKIKLILQQSKSILIVKINKLNSGNINSIRKILRSSEVKLIFVKNSIFRLIIKDSKFKCLHNFIKNQIAIVFSMNHPGIGARLFENFCKEYNGIDIISASFNGELILPNEIFKLTSLLTKEEAILKLINTLKKISVINLLTLLNNIINLRN